MCGIVGVVDRVGAPPPSLLRTMAAQIAHRGPDALAVHVEPHVGLGHTRLSIIDLESGGQPMSTDDGGVSVVFNGEIFNHVELRAALEAKGHRFRTRSDTEVLLHAYLEHGEACVERFNGQWAFAIWDRARKRLFASRDRMGIRPFYFSRLAETFVFGSEIKSLFGHPQVSREIDPLGLDQLLTFWATIAPRTMFRGIRELPPGHSLILEGGELRIFRHFRLTYGTWDERRSADDFADELRATLIDSARLRLTRADVPVGAYLSGGLDSTIITAVAARLSDAPLKTFSVTFEDAEFDESGFQRDVIAHLGVDHHQVLCRGEDIARVFPDVIWHAEQALLRTAPAPMYLLSRLVREHGYKVVLTGEGSDEMLGGYDIFKEAKIRRFWAKQPDSKLRPLLLRRLYPYMPGIQRQTGPYLQAFFQAAPSDIDDPFFSHLPRWRTTEKIKLFYSPEMRSAIGDRDALAELCSDLPNEYADWDPFCRAQYLESRYLMPGYILSSQGDRQAMGNGVEGRYPFLDFRVVELASRIPPTLKMRGLDEKYILKRAFRDLIPAFLHRRPKQPYRAPDARSFFDGRGAAARFEYVDALLSEDAIRRAGVFNPSAVGRLVEKARQGKVVGMRDGMSLVAVLSTQLVVEQFVRRVGKMSHGNADSKQAS